MKRAIELSGGAPQWSEFLAYIYAMAGQKNEAIGILTKLMKQLKRPYLPPGTLALAYMALGDSDRAFYWLEQACAARQDTMVTLRTMPELDPLRSDPRFLEMVRRMNFPK